MQKIIQRFLFLLLFFTLRTPLCDAGSFLDHFSKDDGPIDVVYTWVNSKEPAWKEARQETLEAYELPKTKDANNNSRFRNRDELKYSLRSLHRFAKFVNHIYIVTMGQRPKWLKDHHKITVIDHQEIFQRKAHLPTFNSQAIESNLHRIKNLSERFIYFNDDVFLSRPLKEEDFFTRRGKIKVFLTDNEAPTGPYNAEEDNGFRASWKHTNALLDSIFGRQKRYVLAHGPFALRRSQLEMLEELLPEVFSNVSSHKFRSPDDYTIVNGLIQYFALYGGRAKEGDIEAMCVPFKQDIAHNAKLLSELVVAHPHIFCIEDAVNGTYPEADEQLHAFFEKLFPYKAPWEK